MLRGVDSDRRGVLLVEAVRTEMLERIVLPPGPEQHAEDVLEPRDGTVECLQVGVGDPAKRIAEVHRVDVGAAAQEVEPDLGAGLNHQGLAAGLARDLDDFGNDFGLRREDERTGIEPA